MSSIYATLLGAAAMSSLAILIGAWRIREFVGARALLVMSAGMAWWALSYAAHWLAGDASTARFWLHATWFGVMAAPSAIFAFTLAITGRVAWPAPRLIVGLVVFPALGTLLLFTDRWHGLFLAGRQQPHSIQHGGVGLWVSLGYVYILVAISVVLLLRGMRAGGKTFRRQAALVLAGIALPVAASVLGLAGLGDAIELDLTPMMFTLTAWLIAFSIWRHGITRVLPRARDLVIESMPDGVIVVDMDEVVLDMNAAAMRLLGLDRVVTGSPLSDVAPHLTGVCEYREKDESLADVVSAVEDRRLELRCLPFEAHGEPAGTIVLLRDITERLAAEAEIASLASAREQVVERLQATLDSLIDAHMLFAVVRDESGQVCDFIFEYVNGAACVLLDGTRDEIVGTRLLDRYPVIIERQRWEAYVSLVEQGEPLAINDLVFEHHLVDGQERRFDLRGVRCLDGMILTWHDVTDRYCTARALADSEEHFRLLAENSSDVVVRILPGGTIGWVSPSLHDALGWSPQDWQGTCIPDYLHEADREIHAQTRDAVAAGERTVSRFRLCDSAGSYHWVEIHAQKAEGPDGADNGVVLSFRTVDKEVAAEHELERRDHHDELTGALNRRAVFEAISAAFEHQPRTGGESAILYVDVDLLRETNERFGHAGGDLLLRAVAERMGSAIRQSDTLGRIGGDEFLVWLQGVHGADDAIAIAEKIRQRVSVPLDLGRGTVTPAVSIGVSMVRGTDTADALIEHADGALLAAKRSGRDQVILIT